MKKLLLYLMTLLVFGAVPVDSFAAKGDYLIIQRYDDNYSFSPGDANAFSGSSCSREDVVIGTSKFAIGVYNELDNKTVWYRPSAGNNVGTDISYKMVEIATTSGYSAPNNWKSDLAVITIDGANSGEAYDFYFNAKSGYNQGGTLSITSDYSRNKVTYKAAGNSNWEEYEKNLSAVGMAQFEINTGDNEVFNVWFTTPANTTAAFGGSGGLATNFDGKAVWSTTVDKLNTPGGSSFNEDTSIKGLKKNTSYRVVVDYPGRKIELTEVPTTIYIIGQPSNSGWPTFPRGGTVNDADAFELYDDPTRGTVFQKKIYIDENNYFSFHVGKSYDVVNRYDYHNSDDNLKANGLISGVSYGNTKEFKLIHSGGSNDLDPYAMKFASSSQWVLIQIQLDDANKPCKVWFTGISGNDPLPGEPASGVVSYENTRMTTVYANGSKAHTTFNVTQDETSGDWIGYDKGNYNQPDAIVDYIYDGLGLGYDNFYIRTYSQYGDVAYWALPANSGEITPGVPVTFQRYDTAAAALASNTHVANTGDNYQNTHYDVTFNLTTKEVTITKNAEWIGQENQMYLYQLTDKEIEDKVWTNNMLTYALDEANKNRVFTIPKGNEDGLYQTTITKEMTQALTNGTRFVIIGRTGTVYNVNSGADNNGAPFNFGADWDQKSYRVQLIRSASQEPAIISTDKIAQLDIIVKVRANFSEGSYDNDYLLTFEEMIGAPVKFEVWKENGTDNYEKTDIVLTKNENDDTYTVENIKLPKGTKINFKAIYANGSSTSYYPATESGTRGYDVWGSEAFDNLTDSSNHNNWGFYIGSDNLEDKAQIDIRWNNGEPKVVIQRDGNKKLVTVYFVDRAKWGDNSYDGGTIYCYNYSDIGVGKVDGKYPETDFKNAKFPGQSMGDPYMNTAITSGLDMNGAKLYTIDLLVEQHEDGTYNYPKLIFSHKYGNQDGHDKYWQTRNLYLVDGGIYSNADATHPDTEYLPRMQYNYWESNPLDIAVNSYPNDFYPLQYNEIYLNVPELTKYVMNGNKVAVSISYKRDGKDFIATGIPGKHLMSFVNIGGVDLLRLQLADDVVPDNTTVNIDFWPLGYANEDVSNITKDNHNGDAMTKDCTYPSENGTHYKGDHFLCKGAMCSLNFTDVNFASGNVYQRYYDNKGNSQDPVSDIRTVAAPKNLYLVIMSENPFDAAINTYDALRKVQASEISGSGLTATDKVYELTLPNYDEPDKISYVVPEVLAGVHFYLLAKRKDDTFKTYSTEPTTGSSDCQMLPNNPYTYAEELKNWYTINSSSLSNVKNYDLHISWTGNYVMAEPNKVNADFRFVELTDQGFKARYGYGIMLPAHKDNCGEDHLSKIFFSYAPGYDDDVNFDKSGNERSLDSRLGQLKISKPDRRADYDKFFPASSEVNKESNLVERTRLIDDDQTLVGDYIAIVKKSNATTQERGIGYILMRGYTANIVDLHLEQTVSDIQFHRSGINIPVRIFPTIEGIGLHINDIPVSKTSDGKTYEVTVLEGDHMDGNVNFKDRLQFECTSALYEIDGKQVIRYFWDADPEAKTSIMRREVTFMSDPNASKLISDVTKEQFDNKDNTNTARNLSEFSIHNAPKVDTSVGSKKNVYLQIEQNGMKSPVYTINVARGSKDNIATEVEEIVLGGEEVEAVYYNLNGVRVVADRLEPGIYVKVQGSKSEKIYVK